MRPVTLVEVNANAVTPRRNQEVGGVLLGLVTKGGRPEISRTTSVIDFQHNRFCSDRHGLLLAEFCCPTVADSGM